jgi:predicted Zn-dependent protease
MPSESQEPIRRSYSEEEVTGMYELARLFLEGGSLRKAEAIFQGLTVVAPDFIGGWLGLSYLHLQARNPQSALNSSRAALRIDEHNACGMLYSVIALFQLGDPNAAGTLLGEVRELIDGNVIDDPHIIALYRAQVARFDERRRTS